MSIIDARKKFLDTLITYYWYLEISFIVSIIYVQIKKISSSRIHCSLDYEIWEFIN